MKTLVVPSLVLLLALQACTARIEDEGGIGGTGMIAGSVTNVADLQINGQRLSAESATILRNDEPQLNLQDAFAVGEYLTLETRVFNGVETVQSISYRSPVTGPVLAAASGEEADLQVLGQSVALDELAVLRGFSSVSELQDGDWIEVSGYRDGDLTTATALVLLDDDDDEPQTRTVRLEGDIDTVDQQARSLVINGVQVLYTPASLDNLTDAEVLPNLAIVVTGVVDDSGRVTRDSSAS